MPIVSISENGLSHIVPDSYLDSVSATTNFGTSFLQVGFLTGKTPVTRRSILKFDIVDISNFNLPSGTPIVSAILVLMPRTSSAAASSSEVRRVTTTGWTEAGVTWNSAIKGLLPWTTAGGDFDGTVWQTFNLPTSTASPIYIDLTTIVQDAVDNRSADLHIILKRATESTTDGMASFLSGEDATPSKRPELIITYVDNTSEDINLFIHGHDHTSRELFYTDFSSSPGLKVLSLQDFSIETLSNGAGYNSLDLDKKNQKLYFVDNTGNDRILRIETDGQNPTTISQQAAGNTLVALGIDPIDEKIYYSNINTGKIIKANYDGSSPSNIITNIVQCRSIFINIKDRKIYWTEGNNVPVGKTSSVNRANLDGTSIERLIQFDEEEEPNPLIGLPIDLYVYNDIDSIFFVDSIDNVIYKMNKDIPSGQTRFNRTDIEAVITSTVGENGLVIDEQTNHIYYGDHVGNKILRANIDGSDITILATGTIDPLFLKINQLGSLALFIEGIGYENNDTDLFIHGHETETADIDFFIHGHDTSLSGISLIINAFDTNDQDIDLFIHGFDTESENITLVINGNETSTEDIDIFIKGRDIESNDIFLFISTKNTSVHIFNLFIHGFDIETSNIDLFINAHEMESNDVTLFITAKDSSSENIDLFIHGFNTSSGNIDLIIFSKDSNSNNLDLFIKAFETQSGSISLIINGTISQQNDIILFIPGFEITPASGSIDLLIFGKTDLVEFSCPTLDPNSSIQISNDLIEIYQSRIDALINQLGKNIKLQFDDTIIECINCFLDILSNRSRGIYKFGGPRPFNTGQICPYCKGKGFLKTIREKCIRGLIRWSPKDAIGYGISISKYRAIVRFKTMLIDYPDLVKARFAIVDTAQIGLTVLRVRLIKMPYPVGLRDDRYCISFWELI